MTTSFSGSTVSIWSKNSLQIHISLTLKHIFIWITFGLGRPNCLPSHLKSSRPSIDILTWYKAQYQFRGKGTWLKRQLLAASPILPWRGKKLSVCSQSCTKSVLFCMFVVVFFPMWFFPPPDCEDLEIRNYVVCSQHTYISETVNKIKHQTKCINPAKAKTRHWVYQWMFLRWANLYIFFICLQIIT